jgi:hypothetical protein
MVLAVLLGREIWRLTKWNIMVRVQGNILLDFDLIYTFQNGQSMADTVNSHFFQLLVLQGNERFADNPVFW